jgi:hypothetical protein
LGLGDPSDRSWLEKDGSAGRALHLESGIILARDDGTLVYSCGQDNGRTEVMVGTITPEYRKHLEANLRRSAAVVA